MVQAEQPSQENIQEMEQDRTTLTGKYSGKYTAIT
jgi:hypothetical protein